MQVVETLLPWLATLFIGIVAGMALQKNRVRYIVDTIALTCGGYDQANEVLKALQTQLNQPANLVPSPTPAAVQNLQNKLASHHKQFVESVYQEVKVDKNSV